MQDKMVKTKAATVVEVEPVAAVMLAAMVAVLLVEIKVGTQVITDPVWVM
jgi:hypothetical protein